MSARSSATSALRLTFSVFTSTTSVFISPNAVFVSLIVLPTSIISPFSFPTNSFSRHCTSLQNSKSASVFTTCVLISNSCPLLPQVPTTKTPSAYSVLHCPRWIPPNPAGGIFMASSVCVSVSSARAVFAQHNNKYVINTHKQKIDDDSWRKKNKFFFERAIKYLRAHHRARRRSFREREYTFASFFPGNAWDEGRVVVVVVVVVIVFFLYKRASAFN